MPTHLDLLEPPPDFIDTLDHYVENPGITPEDVSSLRSRIAQDLLPPVVKFRAELARILSKGVLLSAGVPEPGFAPIISAIEDRVAKLKSMPPPDYAFELIVDLERLAHEYMKADQLLNDYAAAASVPRPQLPLERVRQAQEAFARGETKKMEKQIPTNGP